MRQDWLPKPKHRREIHILLEGFAAFVEGRTALYVSSPLTTGRRAFQWHVSNGFVGTRHKQEVNDNKFRRDVIELNRSDATAYVRRLRQTTRQVVIDPTAMGDIPGWTQGDYQAFWGNVIERYAESVIFRDGWMFSNGCAYEFFVAQKSGARMLRADRTPLNLVEGRELINQAVEESHTTKVAAGFLQDVLVALSGIASEKVRQ
jgi:hypothetical protein